LNRTTIKSTGAASKLGTLREQFKSLGRILDRAELASLPKPIPLIEGWIDTRTAVVMIGATGTNKTFTLIGWACSMATGKPWLGHEVKIEPCTVIYVVGEGASGFDARISAWELEHDLAVPEGRLILMLQPDSLTLSEFWEELRKCAQEVGARLIILDTFSSLAPDADESKDAATVVRHMTQLSGEIDGAVVLAHHTGWGPQNRARGGSQLESNPDSTVVLQKLDPDNADSVVSVWRKKDKDGPAGKKIHISRTVVGQSCVLELVDAPEGGSLVTADWADAKLTKVVRAVLDVLRESADGMAITELRAAVGGNNGHVRQAVDALAETGRISKRSVDFKGASGRAQSKTVYVFETDKIPLRPTQGEGDA
jgi:hypothetical protein